MKIQIKIQNCKPFFAESAGERSLLCVASMVSAQFVRTAKPLLTLTTRQPGRWKLLTEPILFLSTKHWETQQITIMSMWFEYYSMSINAINCKGKGKKPFSISQILLSRLPFVLKGMSIEYHCIAIKMSKSVPVYLTFPSINYHHHPDPREIVETSRNAPPHEWRVCRWTKKELDKQNRCRHHYWDPLSQLQRLHCCSWEFDKTALSPKMLASLFSSKLSSRLRAFSETSGVEIFDHICHRRTLFCQPPLGQRSS